MMNPNTRAQGGSGSSEASLQRSGVITMGLPCGGLKGVRSQRVAGKVDAPLLSTAAHARPLSDEEVRRVDPAGQLGARGLRLYVAPYVADRLSRGTGDFGPQLASLDSGRGEVVFDAQYLKLSEQLSARTRKDLVRCLLEEEVSVDIRNRVSRALLTGDGACVFEPIGVDVGLVGITRASRRSVKLDSSLSGEAAERVQSVMRQGLAALDGIGIVVEPGLPTPLVFDSVNGIVKVDSTLSRLNDSELLALGGFAMLLREAASRSYASSRSDRLARGMLDVALELSNNAALSAPLDSALKVLRGSGWDTSRLDAVLEGIKGSGQSLSVSKFSSYKSRTLSDQSGVETLAVRGERIRKSLDAYSLLARKVYPAVSQLLATKGGAPVREPTQTLPTERLLEVAAMRSDLSVIEIQELALSQKEYAALMNFGDRGGVERFADLLSIYTPAELAQIADRRRVDYILRAIDAPQARHRGPEWSVPLRESMFAAQWLKASLGDSWREVMEPLVNKDLRLTFLSSLRVRECLRTYLVKPEDASLSGLSSGAKRLEFGDELLTRDAPKVFDLLSDPLRKQAMDSLLKTLASAVARVQTKQDPRIEQAVNRCREQIVKRHVFLAADRMWGEQPDASTVALLNQKRPIAELIAAEERSIVSKRDLLTRSALILKGAGLKAPGTLEAALTAAIQSAGPEVFAIHIDRSDDLLSLERAAIRYGLATPGTTSHEAALERLEAVTKLPNIPAQTLSTYIARLLRADRGIRAVRIALHEAGRRGMSELAAVGVGGSELATVFSSLPKPEQEQLTGELFPSKEALARIDDMFSSPPLKHALLRGLPEGALGRFLNELPTEQQVSVLSRIDDPKMIRRAADESESRLAANAILYRHAYDQCIEGLPRTISSMLFPKPIPNLYALLGVPKGSSLEDVRRSGKMLQMLFHPDRNIGDVDAEARFKEIVAALDIFTDREKRAAYDRSLPTRAGLYPTAQWMSLVPKQGK